MHSKLTAYEEQILDWSQKYQNIRVQNEKIKLVIFFHTFRVKLKNFTSGDDLRKTFEEKVYLTFF